MSKDKKPKHSIIVIELNEKKSDVLSIAFNALIEDQDAILCLMRYGLGEVFMEFIEEIGEIAHDPKNNWCKGDDCQHKKSFNKKTN